MTGAPKPDILRSLVDLAEAFNTLNMGIRTEVERRAGHSILSNEEIDLLSYVLGNPDSTLEVIADGTGHRSAAVVRSARTLERLGLLTAAEGDGPPALRTFRATPAGVRLRATTRELCTQQMRYAISGMPAGDRAELERAAAALAALGSALGYQGLHNSYAQLGTDRTAGH